VIAFNTPASGTPAGRQRRPAPTVAAISHVSRGKRRKKTSTGCNGRTRARATFADTQPQCALRGSGVTRRGALLRAGYCPVTAGHSVLRERAVSVVDEAAGVSTRHERPGAEARPVDCHYRRAEREVLIGRGRI